MRPLLTLPMGRAACVALIAAGRPACVRGAMLTVDEALAQVLAAVEPLPAEPVPLGEARLRVLAEDVTSGRTLPPFDNAQMDGYAVRAADLAGAAAGHGVVLCVTQAIFAGGRPTASLERGEAARITTGAPIPPGADAVVMQEQARAVGDRVELYHAPRPGEYVRPAGEDLRARKSSIGSKSTQAGVRAATPHRDGLWGVAVTDDDHPGRPADTDAKRCRPSTGARLWSWAGCLLRTCFGYRAESVPPVTTARPSTPEGGPR